MTMYQRYVVLDDDSNVIIGATEGVFQLLPELRNYFRARSSMLCVECGGKIPEKRLRRNMTGARYAYCSASCTSRVDYRRRLFRKKKNKDGDVFSDGLIRWG